MQLNSADELSGFIDLVERGDVILADKGFPSIESDVNEAGGILVMPPFRYTFCLLFDYLMHG